MRTITVETYTPHGTTSAICVALHYRGRQLHEVCGHKTDIALLSVAALTWAQNQGFTHHRNVGDDRKHTI
jgi:hypothetical protein